jgi:hypothetical protein
MRGSWRVAHLMRTLEGMLIKALEMGVCFRRAPFLGNMDAPFLGPLKEERKFFN